jgi:hypothetical protein
MERIATVVRRVMETLMEGRGGVVKLQLRRRGVECVESLGVVRRGGRGAERAGVA